MSPKRSSGPSTERSESRRRIDYAFSRPESEAHFDGLNEVLSDAFNFPANRFREFRDRVADSNFRIVREREQVVGGLAIVPMGQWFGGCRAPMAGIVAVGVHPAWRSKGAGSALMRETVRDLHAMGYPLSALYPATQPIYRRAGYEQAGGLYWCEIDTDRIDVEPDRTLEMTPIDMSDETHLEAARAVHQRHARVTNGNLDRGEYIWSRIGNHKGTPARGFLMHQPDAAVEESEGYLFYIKEETPEANYDLRLTDAAALTAAAGRGLWRFLADHRSMAPRVMWQAPPFLPIFNLLREQPYRIRLKHHWMLRIVDVARAIEARGYAPGVSGELHLEIHGDTALPEVNNARFAAHVENGRAHAVRRDAGSGELRLHINGLAALYSGHLSAFDLARLDLAESESEETLALASSIFSSGGQPPWMADMF